MEDEDIVLEIEDTSIKCNKKLLSSNSDYFRVMFEGDFVERNQSVIRLHGIDLKSMNIILQLLWDDTHIIENEDILLVLQTACMLQFEHIRRICIETITQRLKPDNCLKVWLSTEQLDIVPLYLKAKNMALMQYEVIKDLDCLWDISLKQLRTYLANIYLKCENEINVFLTGLRWFFENSKNTKVMDDQKQQTNVLLSVLSCLSFGALSDSDIKLIMTYPVISDNEEICKILNCVLDIRNTRHFIYDNEIINKATAFCQSGVRFEPKALCIFMDNLADYKRKRQKMSSQVYYDKYKRKRVYVVLDDSSTESNIGDNFNYKVQIERHPKSIVYYDNATDELSKFLNIPEDKYKGLEGFSLIGYKEFIFMLGGEMSLGRGNWNYNFWVYDTIKERWERKTKMPCGRRHFECCIVNDLLYIIGGTGNFRVLQENMLLYNYKEDKWSSEVMLPCRGLQVKCCEYNNQLLLLNINEKVAYIYEKTSQWTPMKIKDSQISSIYPDKFSLFAYKDSIFIKGSSLIKMKAVGPHLEVVNYKYLRPTNCDSMQSVICNNILYTLYKQTMDDQTNTFSVEKFNMETHEQHFLFENVTCQETLEIDGDLFKFSMTSKILAFEHNKLLVGDMFV